MLIDIHCHLDHFYYKNDLKDVIERAKKNNMIIITNGVNFETNLFSLKLAEDHKIIKPALGFYPPDAFAREVYFEGGKIEKSMDVKEELKKIIELIEENNNKIIAIGEIGLDLYNGKNLEEQKEVLGKLIKSAIKFNKPVILHSRKAEKEMLEFLNNFNLNPDKVILHCFSGRKSLIQEAISRGYNFSIPANITRNETFQYLAKIIPLNKIFTETDAPYLSPYKNPDGSFNRNESVNVKETIKAIAKIKQISEHEIEKQIEDNFLRVFENI